MWLIVHKSILTMDVLAHRGWKRKGNTSCQFCGQKETTDHLFLHCSLARFDAWNVLPCASSIPALPGTVAEIWVTWLLNFEGETKEPVTVVCRCCWCVVGDLEYPQQCFL